MTRTRLFWRFAQIPLVVLIGAIAATERLSAQTQTLASSEYPYWGTVSGSYLDTHGSDDVYEALTEAETTGGKPSKRSSVLRHFWHFDNVPASPSLLFSIEAYHTPNGEGDDFVFSWSTDESTYHDFLTVTKTADDGIPQTMPLPPGTSGTICIRVEDTDESQGNRSLETLFVDHMYIEANSSNPPGAPEQPTDAEALSFTSSTVHFGWVDNSDNEDGFMVETSMDGTMWVPAAMLGPDEVLFQATNLTASTTLYYRVAAFNTSFGASPYSDVAVVTTRDVGGYTSDVVWAGQVGDFPGRQSHAFGPSGQVGMAIKVEALGTIHFAELDVLQSPPSWIVDEDLYSFQTGTDLRGSLEWIDFAYSPSDGAPSMLFTVHEIVQSSAVARQLIFGQKVGGSWQFEVVEDVSQIAEGEGSEFSGFSLAFRPDGVPAVAYGVRDEDWPGGHFVGFARRVSANNWSRNEVARTGRLYAHDSVVDLAFDSDGKPAIAFTLPPKKGPPTAPRFQYIAADDTDGTSWSTEPEVVQEVYTTGPVFLQFDASGRPSVIDGDPVSGPTRNVYTRVGANDWRDLWCPRGPRPAMWSVYPYAPSCPSWRVPSRRSRRPSRARRKGSRSTCRT